jgi:hypothetical protein
VGQPEDPVASSGSSSAGDPVLLILAERFHLFFVEAAAFNRVCM